MPKNKKLVLIVDDDDKLIKMLKFLFTAKGFLLNTASNGKEALQILEESTPDAIILDIMMPVMDGCVCMEKIKNSNRLSKIPIIVLTAAGFAHPKEELLELGATDYIEKPFKCKELIDKVLVY